MKFQKGDRVQTTETYTNIHTKEKQFHTRTGTVIDTAAAGQHVTGTSKGTENRYRIQWDTRRPRTWFRESALSLITSL